MNAPHLSLGGVNAVNPRPHPLRKIVSTAYIADERPGSMTDYFLWPRHLLRHQINFAGGGSDFTRPEILCRRFVPA
jgi:hypothetical protein